MSTILVWKSYSADTIVSVKRWIIDAEEFIAVKGFKAKGKRITTYTVDTINELEPTRFPEPELTNNRNNPEEEPENLDPDSDKSEGDIIDEITGQMKLF